MTAAAEADAEAEALVLLESTNTSSHTATPRRAHKNYFLQYSKRSLVRDLWGHLIDLNGSFKEIKHPTSVRGVLKRNIVLQLQ